MYSLALGVKSLIFLPKACDFPDVHTEGARSRSESIYDSKPSVDEPFEPEKRQKKVRRFLGYLPPGQVTGDYRQESSFKLRGGEGVSEGIIEQSNSRQNNYSALVSFGTCAVSGGGHSVGPWVALIFLEAVPVSISNPSSTFVGRASLQSVIVEMAQ